MRGKFHIIGGIALAVGANASAQSGAAASSDAAEPTAALQSLVQNCSAHKFETTILVPGENGKSEPKKVRMALSSCLHLGIYDEPSQWSAVIVGRQWRKGCG